VMYAGRLVEAGPVRQIFNAPAHPYTKALIESIPRLGDATVRPHHVSADPADSHARFALARLLVRTDNFERNQSDLHHAAQLLDEAEKIEPSPLFQAQLYYQKAFLDAYRRSPAVAVLDARKGLAFLDQVETAKPLPAEHRNMRPELRQLISDGGRLKPSTQPPQ